ncbi:MAG: Mth938-like domain-containing protein [Rhodospirillales bacterium]|nr:Mth938-like domain-containing protein [Rhodospirillales bacterium]
MGAPPPAPHPDRKVVDAYGKGVITIRGEAFRAPIVLLPDAVLPWTFGEIGALTADDFVQLTSLEKSRRPAILLIGMGARALFVKPAVRTALRDAGIVADLMDTGAACRTYNVLLAEERRVAACLVPV